MRIIMAQFLYSFPLLTFFMEIRLSRPCVDDPTRYIAECHLGKRLDMEKLCEILRETGAKELKCSLNLGVARFELEERSVMLYKSGRVDIRKIRTTEEARIFLEKINSLVSEALSDISS
jgi:ArsR family metal-binding transcriptional regulator